MRSALASAMNMAGPGDHWQSDLLGWGLPAFGEPVDAPLRDVHRLGGASILDQEPWSSRLSLAWPRWTPTDAAVLARLAEDLKALRDRLRREAIDAGWDVEPQDE